MKSNNLYYHDIQFLVV